ncbi:MAG: hypothetical protein PW789_04965 [Edaphobacter sp.]|uniref:hypothetical protein n=1 Tax=Edaphobacter sp. TaxID=1934404 RepID=UPI002399AA06|nr:hypothetical protein [Edaphobacter sp.]MDE1175939.1 hypothetical protein [Edaphobacter sp.]
MRWIRLIVICLVAILGATAFAQQPASAPVPPALTSAKSVFVSNAGSDSGLFPHPFSGAPDRAYNEFYDGMKGLGRFDLVSDPSQADLVLELQLTAPNGPKDADKAKGGSDPLPMLRLVIWDRRSHFVLWALTESVDKANLQKTHDKNFDDAISSLVKDLERIAGTKP